MKLMLLINLRAAIFRRFFKYLGVNMNNSSSVGAHSASYSSLRVEIEDEREGKGKDKQPEKMPSSVKTALMAAGQGENTRKNVKANHPPNTPVVPPAPRRSLNVSPSVRSFSEPDIPPAHPPGANGAAVLRSGLHPLPTTRSESAKK